MQNSKLIAKILLPLAFDECFSYFAPEDTAIEVEDVVLVNFVKRNIYGVVMSVEVQKEESKYRIKKIIKKEEGLRINSSLLKLIEFCATYNMSPKGLFLKLAISILNSTKNKENSDVFYQINKNIPENIKITEKRQKIIDIFNQNSEILAQDLENMAQISKSTLSSLVKSEFLIKNIKKTEIKHQLVQNFDKNLFNLKKLSKSQRETADFLKNQVENAKYSVTLLDGVTGSGKTEVYFEAISQILNEADGCKGGQILILLPEIILAGQLIKRFESSFNFAPVIWHSKINNNQKRDIFYSLNSGEIKVLIGTRSALFLPFKNLKLIVVDEEHESSFKQEDIVNYHGRDMAIVRSKIEGIPIILSSATPSLETYTNALDKKYHHQILQSKFFKDDKADISVIDMKSEGLNKNQFISNSLSLAIANSINSGEQSLLFLNRRGYAPLSLCGKCGHKVSCINCSSYVTYHQKINKLICHHCGYEARLDNKCKSCDEENSLITLGVGVEKVKEEIERLFPDAKIVMLTSDTMSNEEESGRTLEKIINNEVDIIIGTQIIAKGHHFPNLSLVGIVDGDSSFNNSDLRTVEKSYQLLTQVIGRAGREKHRAKILLQSFNTQNLLFKYICGHKRDEFFNLEIQNRKIATMPPFSKMIAIIFISKIEDSALNAAKFILKQFPAQDNIEIFGPAPMPISKIRKHYYYRILVKSDKKLNIQKLIKSILDKSKLSSNVRVKVDVDPL